MSSFIKLLAWLVLPVAVALSTLGTSVSYASVDNLTITDFQTDFYLERDSDHRSRLKTVEHITVEFPQTDQNHGIERAIPQTYDNHPTHLTIQSVTDGRGASLNYTTYESNGNKVVRIGDPATYIHGSQQYILTYEQRDVTLRPTDRAVHEFYWDVNGTEWRVPFGSVAARVHLPTSLAEELTGEAACYVGSVGSSTRCTITKTTEASTTTFTIPPSRPLFGGENVTLAIGFREGTFAAYEPSLQDRFVENWALVNKVLVVVGIGILLWHIKRRYTMTERPKEQGTIVTEYLPPPDTSVTAAAQVLTTWRSVMTAQLLDFAVRHYVKLYEVKKATLFSPAEYELEIVKNIEDLTWEEREILSDMFAGKTNVGQRLNLKKLRFDFGFTARIANNQSGLNKLLRGQYGLLEKRPENVAWFRRAGSILLVASLVTLSPALFVVGVLDFICSFSIWSLTDKALVLRRYLKGFKRYIRVAEQERIKMLQSPEGAEKVASVVRGTDTGQLVKLYERALPYAVLFGHEKKWSKQLGAYYEKTGSSPDWYSGTSGAYSAAVFANAMNSFSASTNTYAASASSGSSGSSGGGSSGGGGGGGGGGGW